jgi:hypothetical protein
MKHSRIALAFFLLGFACLLATACATHHPDPIAIVERHAGDFNEATPAVKNIWDQVVATVNSSDHTAALSALEALRNEEGLTPAQSQAVTETERAIKSQPRLPPKQGDTPN